MRAAALAAILLVYLVLACGYALATPRWNTPDEPAHYNYISHLARTGQFPVLQPGDWDSQALSERLASGRFSTQAAVDEFRYEGHQPPLYYLIMAPLYRLVEGMGAQARVVALRSVSIGLGMLVILVVYAAVRTLAPNRGELAPLAAGIVAFIPMHMAMNATINNDTLAELMSSLTLLAIIIGLRRGFGIRETLIVGVLCAGLLLTKLTVYLFVPLALLALGARRESVTPPRHRDTGDGTRTFSVSAAWDTEGGVRRIALATAVMTALAGWWFLRNLLVYGWPDLFGLIRHDQVVVGQPRWAGLGLEPVAFLAYSLFRSFWAQFGWMAVVLDPRIYGLFLLFVVLSVAGLRRFWREELPAWDRSAGLGLRFLVAALALVVGQIVAYNFSFIQAQGRYLYPASLPLGLLLGLGWSALAQVSPCASGTRWLVFALGFYWLWAAGVEGTSWLLAGTPAPLFLHLVPVIPLWLASKIQVRRPPESLARIAAEAVVVVLALLNAAALLRFVVPYFQGW